MVHIRNVKGKDALLHIDFREAPGKLSALLPFHDNNGVSPRKLVFCHRTRIVESCAHGIVYWPKQLLSSFAAVLVLVADEKQVHALA